MRQIHSAFHEQYHDDPHPQQDPPPRDSARNECFRLIVASAHMAGVHCYPVANSDGRARQQRKIVWFSTTLFSFFCVGAQSQDQRRQEHNHTTRWTMQQSKKEQRARVHTKEREKETTIRMVFFFSWVEGALSHSQPRKDDGARRCGEGARATLWQGRHVSASACAG